MKKISGLTWFVLIVWLAYAYLTLTSPVGDNVFELSVVQLFLIRASIAVPYLFVWMAALYGANKLTDYASSIYESADGRALLYFAKGLYVLLAGMIVSTLLSAVTGKWLDLAEYIRQPNQILLNYIYVVFPLLAFGLFLFGIRQFRLVAPKMQAVVKPALPILIITTIAAAVFVIAVFTNGERQVSADGEATYYLSDTVLVLTLVVPTILSWFLGLFVVAGVRAYQREVRGSIYKASLRKLSWGLISVVVASIVLQFLISLGSTRLLGLGLGIILVWIYVWLVALAVGYILVASGAGKLARLEEQA